MHNALAVHVGKGARALEDEVPDLALLKLDFLLTGALDQQLEVALLGPFDCDEEFIQLGVDEPTEVLDDVWVV